MVRSSPDGPGSFYEAVYAVTREVPHGRVATFGWLARAAGSPRAARAVGYAMHALPYESAVPWWRVVNAAGSISFRAGPGPMLQRQMLEDEGVAFDFEGRIDLSTYGWEGGSGLGGQP